MHLSKLIHYILRQYHQIAILWKSNHCYFTRCSLYIFEDPFLCTSNPSQIAKLTEWTCTKLNHHNHNNHNGSFLHLLVLDYGSCSSMKYATSFSSSSLLLSSSLSSLLWLLSGSFLMLYIRVQSSQFFSHKNPLEKWLMLKIVSHEIYGFLWNCVNSKIFKEEIVFNDQSKPEMRVLKGRWIF